MLFFLVYSQSGMLRTFRHLPSGLSISGAKSVRPELVPREIPEGIALVVPPWENVPTGTRSNARRKTRDSTPHRMDGLDGESHPDPSPLPPFVLLLVRSFAIPCFSNWFKFPHGLKGEQEG
jgi:hypothetical protein